MERKRISERKYAAIALAAAMAAIVAAFLLMSAPKKIPQKDLVKKSDFVEKWCGKKDGIEEYRLPDKTRADCFLSGEFAAEFDWSDKWAEAIGQSLHYAAATDAEPWIVLLPRKNVQARAFRSHAAKILRIVDEYELPINIVCLNRKGDEINC